jgi:hypothetical protein
LEKRYTANAFFRERARSRGSVFRTADAAHIYLHCAFRLHSSGQWLGACFSRHCDIGDQRSPREARRRTPPGYGRRPRSAKRQVERGKNVRVKAKHSSLASVVYCSCLLGYGRRPRSAQTHPRVFRRDLREHPEARPSKNRNQAWPRKHCKLKFWDSYHHIICFGPYSMLIAIMQANYM